MQQHKVKMWIGLGAFVLGGAAGSAGAAGTPVADGAAVYREGKAFAPGTFNTKRIEAMTAIQVAQSSEGGEGGEAGHAAMASDDAVAFVIYLRTIESRLQVAKALYDSGDHKNALVHFQRVVRYLTDAKAKVFEKKSGLNREHFASEAGAIPQLIQSKAAAKDVQEVYAHILGEVDENLVKVDAALRRSPGMTIAVSLALLKHAAHEYGDAIKDGKIVKLGDWHAARGLVWTARDVFGAAAGVLTQIDKGRTHDAIAGFDGLQAILASLQPPAKLEDPGKFLALVSAIELQVSGLAQPLAVPGAGDGGEGGEGGEAGK